MDHTRSTTRPAPSLVAASLSFLPMIDFFGEALRRRQIRRSYGAMSIAQLRDIGLTPYELEVALSLPSGRACVAVSCATKAALRLAPQRKTPAAFAPGVL